MVSFDEFIEKAKSIAKISTSRAFDAGKIARLSLANVSEEESLKKIYMEIGKLYYAGYGLCPDGGYEALCDKVTEIKARIEENKAEITEIKINGVVDDEVCDPGDVVG